MDNKIVDLEVERKLLYKKIENLGDLRRGSITESYTKCGKKNCACAKKEHPGHIRYLWSTTVKGKSRSRNLRIGSEMEKYRKEIENCRTFEKLCDELVRINEEICDLRPVATIDNENDLEALKKKLQKLFRKKYREKWRK